ncbi:DNA polymerase eta [Dorcoceras hygrometricum]|uniref:DNA polymerase eta n=1 Tax=Dorcoceras hygrometricum TaxID=472368 RepID=A0A2Z7CP04_9LAMI|nr:DNA polymerase eta [Dorcoceras hygrometricum]
MIVVRTPLRTLCSARFTLLNSPLLHRFYSAEPQHPDPFSPTNSEDPQDAVFDSSLYDYYGVGLKPNDGDNNDDATWSDRYRDTVRSKVFGEDVSHLRILRREEEKKNRAAALAKALLEPSLVEEDEDVEAGEVKEEDQKSLSVGIIGAPNAGKSALTNFMVGTKVSAVSRKTNTTTHEVLGVLTKRDTQICFFDTPGLMLKKSGFPYNDIKVRNESAWSSICLYDVLIVIFDVHRHLTRFFMISGLKGAGVRDLTQYLMEQAVKRPWDEEPLGMSEEVMKNISLEVVRERLLDHVHQEIPYGIEHRLMGWRELRDGSLRIEQHFITHKMSQRKILVGSKGSKIGQIGMEANEELRSIFKKPVHLILMMPVAKPESSEARVIAHIDMDCFYVQVEQRKQPNLRGQPTAVVQYNSWKGGGLIAVGYEARKFGVKRSMRGDEAKKICPEIQLVQVPVARGKADLNVYRNAGSEVISILSRKGRCERASIDEVYLDLTEAAETMLTEHPNGLLDLINEEALRSHVLGLHLDGLNDRDCVREWFLMNNGDHRDKLLACGALIVAELRLEVLKETEFTCSAGIAHNKMLAKLTSGMHKPAQQTIVPFSSVKNFLEPLPIKKMYGDLRLDMLLLFKNIFQLQWLLLKQLGGKLGTSLETELGVQTVGDLLQFSEESLQERYGRNTGTWLWNVARGISGEEVEGRLLPKSHGSGKTFPGRQALKTLPSVQKWLNELCEELSERLQSDLEQNKRIAHTLTLHASAYKLNDSESLKKFPSKSCPLRYGTTKIQEDSLSLFHAGLREYIGINNVKAKGINRHEWAITGLSVSASKIVAVPSGTNSITKYFHNEDQNYASSKESDYAFTNDAASLSPSGIQSWVGSKPTQSKMEFVEEGSGINVKSRKQKRKLDTQKRSTPSILGYFRSNDEASSSSDIPDTTDGCRYNLGEDVPRISNSWNYKSDEIDPGVLNELPPEIQAEVLASLDQPQNQVKTAKRGSSIVHYFLPTKNS